MNVLDENIIEDQRILLVRWRVPTRQIGQDLGHQGMKDSDEVLPLLHQLSRPTLFTRDLGFYTPQLCHEDYCLVLLAVTQYEVASFIRRFLRHPAYNTWRHRSGCVVRISHSTLREWRVKRETEGVIEWE